MVIKEKKHQEMIIELVDKKCAGCEVVIRGDKYNAVAKDRARNSYEKWCILRDLLKKEIGE